MPTQIPLSGQNQAEMEKMDDGSHQLLPDLAYKLLVMANVVFIGPARAGDRKWVLVDAGIPGSAGAIKKAAARRFGPGARPAAIVLTHGHFDHVGALKTLAEDWDVPVFAHELELPFLNGTESYAPPDALIGGIMALASPLYPRGPIDVGPRLLALPDDGTVPFLPEWRWVATPGHAPGHISLWREADRTLVAGDAIITTGQEDVYAVATQKPAMHGPPMYFTPDWISAEESVARVAALEPETVVCGHGVPMQGGGMRVALHELVARFQEVAIPKNGKYTPASLQETPRG